MSAPSLYIFYPQPPQPLQKPSSPQSPCPSRRAVPSYGRSKPPGRARLDQTIHRISPARKTKTGTTHNRHAGGHPTVHGGSRTEDKGRPRPGTVDAASVLHGNSNNATVNKPPKDGGEVMQEIVLSSRQADGFWLVPWFERRPARSAK